MPEKPTKPQQTRESSIRSEQSNVRVVAVSNERVQLEFQIDDLISNFLLPNKGGLAAHCGGCNGCSGCSH
jgi:hypothetical protein